jgi:hypothetical protein
MTKNISNVSTVNEIPIVGLGVNRVGDKKKCYLPLRKQ